MALEEEARQNMVLEEGYKGLHPKLPFHEIDNKKFLEKKVNRKGQSLPELVDSTYL